MNIINTFEKAAAILAVEQVVIECKDSGYDPEETLALVEGSCEERKNLIPLYKLWAIRAMVKHGIIPAQAKAETEKKEGGNGN